MHLSPLFFLLWRQHSKTSSDVTPMRWLLPIVSHTVHLLLEDSLKIAHNARVLRHVACSEYRRTGSFKTHLSTAVLRGCIRFLGNKTTSDPASSPGFGHLQHQGIFQVNCLLGHISIPLHFYSHICEPQLKIYYYPCHISLPCSWSSFPA